MSLFRLVLASVAMALVVSGIPVASLAQPPKKDDKKPDDKKKVDDKKKPEDKKKSDMKKDAVKVGIPENDPGKKPEAQSFITVDGVKLTGLLYRADAKSGSAPIVMILPEPSRDPNETVWHGTARLLNAKGFNVFRFAYRGTGDLRSALHGKDIEPSFWKYPPNASLVKGGEKSTKKVTIDYKDFRTNYLPMFVQDIAAARNHLDQLNDVGDVNTSSVYILGAGDAFGPGMIFLMSECYRERIKPNTVFPPTIVSASRGLTPASEPAIIDYAGVIWLTPTRSQTLFPDQLIKKLVTSQSGARIREMPTLMMYAKGDTKNKQTVNTLFNSVMMFNAKVGPNGTPISATQFAFKREIEGGNVATSLLGNSLGTENQIRDFLAEMESERKTNKRNARSWSKPLLVDLQSFGVLR